MRVSGPTPEELRRVLFATHPIAGGSPHAGAWHDFNRTLLDTPWARAHQSLHVARDDDGRPTTALRITSLAGRLDGRPVRVAQASRIAGFPETSRVEHEPLLFAQALETAAAGHDLALVVSPTGEEPYARHRFEAVPCSEAACRTVLPAPWPKEPPWLREGTDPFASVPGLRHGRTDDIEALAEIHAEETAPQRLCIERPREQWEQIFLTRDLVARLLGVEVPFFVIERERRVVAYVLLQAGTPTLRWREHGARKDAGDLLRDLFWAALAWARGKGLRRIEGWCLPDVLTVLPLYPTSDRRRAGDIVMLKRLDPVGRGPHFAREEECRLWELDAW